MKLCYRGISYESTPTLEVTEGEILGKYRGTPWFSRHLSVPYFVRRSTFGLKYRGAVFGVGTVNFTGTEALAG